MSYTDEQVALMNAVSDAQLEAAHRMTVLLEIMRDERCTMEYARDHLAQLIIDLGGKV